MGRNRLPKELDEMNRDEGLMKQMKIRLINNQLNKLECFIQGPPDTSFTGGNFLLMATIPDNYPFKPPTITFMTKIWHSNVSDNGHICLDILRSKWTPVTTLRGVTPVTTLRGVLLSIQSLMQDPNPNSPLVRRTIITFIFY